MAIVIFAKFICQCQIAFLPAPSNRLGSNKFDILDKYVTSRTADRLSNQRRDRKNYIAIIVAIIVWHRVSEYKFTNGQTHTYGHAGRALLKLHVHTLTCIHMIYKYIAFVQYDIAEETQNLCVFINVIIILQCPLPSRPYSKICIYDDDDDIALKATSNLAILFMHIIL